MLKKTYKFAIVSVVMLLVLGLTLPACTSKKPADTEQPSAPAQAALSFKAKTYTNAKDGFSIQYPDNWVERPEIVSTTIVAAFGVPGFVPGVSLSVRDADKPLTADWIVAANTAEGNVGVTVDSPLKETTLADGTPAIEYKSSFKSSGYDIVSFGISADKDGKRIRATVWTIDAFSPYDEALFSEIAHTLTVK
ncbi:MAG: hypothetical protein FJ023_06265 [Chloroflexi bacterium]|nr:hypothetical protein [Chloroflexota bacterium]